jgi:uncharacterized protein (TIGR00290 family)
MSWSSGKDSALALHEVRSGGGVEIVGLVTTVSSVSDRVAMHEVRRSLVEAQADALQVPLNVVELPWPCPNDVYEGRMSAMLQLGRESGVEAIVYGDLYLEDIRRYREQSLRGSGLTPLFPLWQRPTESVARDLLSVGVRAVITCVDLSQAPAELVGRWFDEELLASLPTGVDPCGENGEFHTFVVDGPGFARPVDVTVGEAVEYDGFAYTDLVPAVPSSTVAT